MPVAPKHLGQQLGVEAIKNLREHDANVAPLSVVEETVPSDVGITKEQPGKNHKVESDNQRIARDAAC